jgi:hypothetical protein
MLYLQSNSSSVLQRPIDPLIRRASITQTRTVVQSNRVVLRRFQVLEINALLRTSGFRKRNASISHGIPGLLLVTSSALAQVDVRHVLPARLRAGVHTKRCVGQLDECGVVGRFDIPGLCRSARDRLPKRSKLSLE